MGVELGKAGPPWNLNFKYIEHKNGKYDGQGYPSLRIKRELIDLYHNLASALTLLATDFFLSFIETEPILSYQIYTYK